MSKVDSDAVAQEASAPPVVVAAQEKYGYPGFHEVGQLREHSDVLGEDDPPVFEPEIEEIAIDDQAAARFLYMEQPSPERLFRLRRDRA